jgi:hypothetical protein
VGRNAHLGGEMATVSLQVKQTLYVALEDPCRRDAGDSVDGVFRKSESAEVIARRTWANDCQNGSSLP